MKNKNKVANPIAKDAGLVKLRQLANILDEYNVFGVKNRTAEINTFITKIDHGSKNVYNTFSLVYRKRTIRLTVNTIRTNGELGIIEIKAESANVSNLETDYRDLNRRLAETLRFWLLRIKPALDLAMGFRAGFILM